MRAVLVVAVLPLAFGCQNLLGFDKPRLADDAAVPACAPEQVKDCFEGPGTAGTGQCTLGTSTCDAVGSWGPCIGQGHPAVELCTEVADENCDGMKSCTGALESAFVTSGGTFERAGVDGQGAIYALGAYAESYVLGDTPLPEKDRGEIVLVRLDTERMLAWVKPIASLGIQIPQALLVGADGETTIAGLYSSDAGEQFMIGTRRLTSINVNEPQTFLARFDADGKPRWAVTVKRDAGYKVGDPARLAAGPNGSVYWLQSSQTKDFAFFDGPVPSGAPDELSPSSAMRLIQVGADGSLLAHDQLTWPAGVEARGIVADSLGGVYLAIVNTGTQFGLGSPMVTIPTGGALVKLGSALQIVHATALASAPTALAVGGGRNLLIGGEPPVILQQITHDDTLGWSVSTMGIDHVSLAVDAAGYVVLAGRCVGPTDFSPGAIGGDVSGSGTCFAKYSGDGALQWSTPSAMGAILVEGIVTDAYGAVIAVGAYAPTGNLGDGPLAGSGSFVLPMRP